MSLDDLLIIALYGAFAAFALWKSWPHEDLRGIGLALVAYFIASNIVAAALPFEYRPAIYPVFDVVVALTAANSWISTHRVWPPAVLVFLSMVSVLLSANYALAVTPGFHDKYFYVVSTNIIFAVQCALLGIWGGLHARNRHYRLDPVPALGGAHPARHASASLERERVDGWR